MTTGRTSPALSWVFALNSLQNAMMLIPADPKAGPMGGAGFAFPARICNLMVLMSFFAMFTYVSANEKVSLFSSSFFLLTCVFSSGLFHLPKLEIIDPCIAAENRDHHAQAPFLVIDFCHGADKVDKDAVGDLDAISYVDFVLLNDPFLSIL